MKHPTPAEIKSEIYKTLADDYTANADDPFVADIPMRAWRLVREAISRACDEASRMDRDAIRKAN